MNEWAQCMYTLPVPWMVWEIRLVPGFVHTWLVILDVNQLLCKTACRRPSISHAGEDEKHSKSLDQNVAYKSARLPQTKQKETNSQKALWNF